MNYLQDQDEVFIESEPKQNKLTRIFDSIKKSGKDALYGKADNIRKKVIERYETTAADIAANKEKTIALINEATEKLKEAIDTATKNNERLRIFWDDFQAVIRMVNAWVHGRYTKAPKQTILLAVIAMSYYVLPVPVSLFRLLKRIIPWQVDDTLIIGALIEAFSADLKEFREWEESAKMIAGQDAELVLSQN